MSAPAASGDRLTALASAIIAVLAALATLFANHASITALSIKNDAVLTTSKASDLFSSYQTKRMRIAVYEALSKPDKQSDDNVTSLVTLTQAKKLQEQASLEEDRSEILLRSYETFEIAATIFEIAIVLASIAALTNSRLLLWLGIALSAIGIILTGAGFLRPH